MKPVSVRFACFGPYMEEQYIDFQQLEAEGLFLICGETGAGKTTILDAICYALYGKSSGALRGDFSVMRCKLADTKDETLVEFIFDSNGKRYKFIRTLKYGRKNLNDSHNCLVLEQDVYVPIFENPKATVVNKKAEELIGLTYEQFRQVIILPQGQFEKLLVSNSEEKEKILVSLFHADRWQRIAEELYRRVADRDEALREEKKQIIRKLREYGCEQLEDLRKLQSDSREALEQRRIQREEVRKNLTAQAAVQEQAILENREFEVLSNLIREQDQLIRQRTHFDREAEILAAAHKAEAIGKVCFDVQESRSQSRRARAQLEQKQLRLQQTKNKFAEAERAMQSHNAQTHQQEERTRQLTLLENARDAYRGLDEKQKADFRADRELIARQTEKEQAEAALSRAEKALQKALQNQDLAIRNYQQAQTQYLQGIGGILAQALVSGQPCPVCGSVDHPTPAQPLQGHITEQQLDELTRAMNEYNEQASQARSRRTGAEGKFREAADAFHLAEQAKAVARRDLENARERILPGIETAAALETAIAQLGEQIETFRRQEQRLTETYQNARSAAAAAEAEVRTALENQLAAQARQASREALWQDALAEAGFASEDDFRACDLRPEERQRRNENLLVFRGECTRVQTQLEQQKKNLDGKTAPDLPAIRRAMTALETEFQTLSGQVVLGENSLKKLTADEKDLTYRSEKHDTARIQTDQDLDFANRIRGRSGVSLQRYVLGVMLTAITLQANRLLEGVYGGRYRLYRTDEIAGNARKGGLELEVLDRHTNARRSVTTLSGGEKFLVALSLAIGLSTVVQAQGGGIRLEAMFIDEGFGSLDRETVYDALEVLQGIGGKAGLVGIISHVDALAEAIPAKIEIQKGSRGSKCVIRC